MRQEEPDRDTLLARVAERRPVAGHWRIQVEQAACQQHASLKRHRPLGTRPDHADGVAVPGPPRAPLRQSAPQIDDWPALQKHTHGRPNFTPFEKIALELVANAPK